MEIQWPVEVQYNLTDIAPNHFHVFLHDKIEQFNHSSPLKLLLSKRDDDRFNGAYGQFEIYCHYEVIADKEVVRDLQQIQQRGKVEVEGFSQVTRVKIFGDRFETRPLMIFGYQQKSFKDLAINGFCYFEEYMPLFNEICEAIEQLAGINQKRGKAGNPGLKGKDRNYRLDKAREAIKLREQDPTLPWKSIMREINWPLSVDSLRFYRKAVEKSQRNRN